MNKSATDAKVQSHWLGSDSVPQREITNYASPHKLLPLAKLGRTLHKDFTLRLHQLIVSIKCLMTESDIFA